MTNRASETDVQARSQSPFRKKSLYQKYSSYQRHFTTPCVCRHSILIFSIQPLCLISIIIQDMIITYLFFCFQLKFSDCDVTFIFHLCAINRKGTEIYWIRFRILWPVHWTILELYLARDTEIKIEITVVPTSVSVSLYRSLGID